MAVVVAVAAGGVGNKVERVAADVVVFVVAVVARMEVGCALLLGVGVGGPGDGVLPPKT